VRSPSVRVAPTEDLRAELNHRRAGEDTPVSLERSNDLRAELNRKRAGEDARVSLERACERRQNVEGRNLDYDFDALAPQTPMGARIQAGVPLAGVGCAALVDHLRAATWPSKFRPHLPKKYDGTTNPSEFLQVYVTAITAAGGDTTVMATYFHVALSGPAWTWLMNLTPVVDLLLGRALCKVHSELCQRLSAAWRGGPPPRSEAGARGNSPGVYLPLHQGTRHHTSYFRCFHHHRFPPGST
jgi:hypothetical protein